MRCMTWTWLRRRARVLAWVDLAVGLSVYAFMALNDFSKSASVPSMGVALLVHATAVMAVATREPRSTGDRHWWTLVFALGGPFGMLAWISHDERRHKQNSVPEHGFRQRNNHVHRQERR